MKLKKIINSAILTSTGAALICSIVVSARTNSDANVTSYSNQKKVFGTTNKYFEYDMRVINMAIEPEAITIYVFGDGFKKNEQNEFYKHVQNAFDVLFQYSQYKQAKRYMNVIAIGTISNQGFVYGIPAGRKSNRDTFFGAYKTSEYDVAVNISLQGQKLREFLKAQGKSRFILANKGARSHMFTYSQDDLGLTDFGKQNSFSSLAFKDNERRDFKVFTHEMSHTFGVVDEYPYSSANATNVNKSSDNNPETISWKELLGFRNTEINKVYSSYSRAYFYTPQYDCMMAGNEHQFCEVCKYHTFRGLTGAFENKPPYISQPFISESFDSLKDFKTKHEEINEKNIDLVKDKKVDLRFFTDNPSTTKKRRIKLKLEYINETHSEYSQTSEEEFVLEPSTIDPLTNAISINDKQLKVTLNKPLQKMTNDKVKIIGRVIDLDTNKEIVNTNFDRPKGKLFDNFDYKDQNKVRVEFYENDKPIDFIQSQDYYLWSHENADDIKPKNIRGYKFSKSETENINGIKTLKWHYTKLPSREITLNLIDSVDSKIAQTRKINIFEGETFKANIFDFLLPENRNGGVIEENPEEKIIEYSDKNKAEINFTIGYPISNLEITNNNISIKQGEDIELSQYAKIMSEIHNNTKMDNQSYKKDIVIDYGNFNNNVKGKYEIKYLFRNQEKTINVNVLENTNFSNNKKEVISEVQKIVQKPIVINDKGKATKIENVTQTNISSLVDNWPENKNGVNVQLVDFKNKNAFGIAEIKFEYSKNNEKILHTVIVKGFQSDEFDVNRELKNLDKRTSGVDRNFFKYDLIQKISLSEFQNYDLKKIFSNPDKVFNPEISGVKIEAIIREMKAGTNDAIVAYKLSKGNYSITTNGFWISGIGTKIQSNHQPSDNPSSNDNESEKPKIESNKPSKEEIKKEFDEEIKKINWVSKKPEASKVLAKNIDKNNYTSYIENNLNSSDILNFEIIKLIPYSDAIENRKISIDVKYTSKKDGSIPSKLIKYEIDGFALDTESIKQEFSNSIEKITLKAEQPISSKTLTKSINKNNLSQYVKNLPSNNSIYTIELEEVKEHSENWDNTKIIVKIKFKSLKNPSSLSANVEYTIDGFKRDEPPIEIVTKEFEDQLNKIQLIAKQPEASQILAKNVNTNNYTNYINNLPIQNDFYDFQVLTVSPKSQDIENTKLSVTIKYKSKKNNTIEKNIEYTIDGFLIDPELIKKEEDKKT